MGVKRWGALGALTILGTLLLALPAAGFGQQDASDKSAGVYIVRLLEAPVVAYEGDIAGYAATKPAKGKKIDPTDQAVTRYAGYLDSRHNAVLGKAGGQKVYDYRYAFNGYAARMTPGQVAKAEADPGVLSVEKAQEVTTNTATTPRFLGLTDPATGLWTAPRNIKGENVVIGVIDSGIWPESKSFSDRDANGKLVYQQIRGFHAKCSSAEIVTDGSWDSNLCNKKLVSAQFFCASRGCDGVLEHEFLSPRDYNGHGTHTASTAGGNEGVATTGGAAVFGSVNGIAPRARIAAYKVCWDNGAGGCGANSGDSVAAIDQAVADGVDVINYSISGTSTNYLDSVEVAYLFASDAGVFVAASAGNSGPTAGTVAHISPWLASVAAGTHNRSGSTTIKLGNGTTYSGVSLTNGVGPAPLIRAQDAGVAGADANLLRQCFSDPVVLDPAKVNGKIVVCERGGAAPNNARVDKSVAVKNAGGVGIVVANLTATQSINADLHSIPAIHVNNVDGAAIATYAQTAGATATIATAVVNDKEPAPAVAGFSSRGPSTAGGGDILKPDFMLPGQDIVAAVAPPGNAGKDFDIYSGTSMSSPHVAGVGALLTQAHPDWSSAALRSAMATTAHQAIIGGYNPFGAGSGQVQPNKAVDPGLVYDAGFNDYLAFLKGQGLCCALSAGIPALDASDLNQPSLSVGDLAGDQTLTRTVTNVGGAAATYTATIVPPAGFTVSVSPASFTIAPGATQQFTVRVTRTDAPLDTFRVGSLTWSDGKHSVFSPIVIRPVAVAAPKQLNLTGAPSGTTTYTIKTGYNGALAYGKRGLIPSQVFSGTVKDDPTDSFNEGDPAKSQGIVTHDIVVPAGSVLLRINMFDAETDGADDIDLYLYRINADGTLTEVALSGGGTSAEQIQIVPEAAGATYRLFVHGWETDGPDAVYKLHSWALGTTDAGNMTVTGPAEAKIGETSSIKLDWAGLEVGKKYFGQILYNEGAKTHATTLVRIDG